MCRGKIKATSVERTHRTQGLDNARHNTISNNNKRAGEAGNKLPKYEARNLNAAASLTLKWQAVYCAHGGVAHLPRLYTMNCGTTEAATSCGTASCMRHLTSASCLELISPAPAPSLSPLTLLRLLLVFQPRTHVP